MNSFYSSKWQNIFINNSATNKTLENLLTVAHIAIDNGGKMVTYSGLKYCIQNYKTSLKIWKYKINILYILTLSVPTPRNGQTHSDNLSAIRRRIVWVCFAILWGLHFKG